MAWKHEYKMVQMEQKNICGHFFFQIEQKNFQRKQKMFVNKICSKNGFKLNESRQFKVTKSLP